MTVMEVCQYGKTDIKIGFHNFRPFPNILAFMEIVPSEIMFFKVVFHFFELNYINGFY